jgi:hypothetical protein
MTPQLPDYICLSAGSRTTVMNQSTFIGVTNESRGGQRLADFDQDLLTPGQLAGRLLELLTRPI